MFSFLVSHRVQPLHHFLQGRMEGGMEEGGMEGGMEEGGRREGAFDAAAGAALLSVVDLPDLSTVNRQG